MIAEDRKILLKLLEDDGVDMQDKGNHYIGKCPFHPDKTPSFVVYKNNYKFVCFGCGEKGDAIDYICKVRDIPFSQAAKYLNIEHRRSKFIKERPDMLQIISDEGKSGIDVEKKYGKDFIDSLLAKRLVDSSNEGENEK